ncbi:S1 family peptidase [Glutamicibacter mysorens]|uniref:S1 family peptidase n=1 Tax=Glutamicibacter mysorens TaxID=257984 RepID=UPI0020C5EDB1|nr:S1 family peptidase [Glutamicibacter mysorens]UTM47468.1 S1 family peptidase [Glutamicibacter mysorens]
MPHPKKKTAQRGIVAAAATALVVGSSFMPAAAAPTVSESPTASTPASEKPSPSASAVDTEGLDKAIERDLDKSVEEYVKDGETSDAVSKVRDELHEKGVEATASVKDGKAEITVGKDDADKAKKIIAETATPAPTTLEIKVLDTEVKTPEKVYQELLKSVAPKEMKRITAILNTGNTIKVYAEGFEKKEAKALESEAADLSAEDLTVEEFVSKAKFVKGEDSSGVAETSALEDVYGAMGYAMDQSGQPSDATTVCSLGFNAWNASGEDAVISAGHCTEDGTTTILGLMEQSAPNVIEGLGAELGTFGFSQFGGPGNSGLTEAELLGMSEEEIEQLEPGTDISVIDHINSDLNLHPAVSQWPEGQDERDQVLNVTGVSKAVVGSEACSAGRTTGWSCSKIFGEGVFFVYGQDDTVRSVWGYSAENPGQTVLDQGDSGGPVLVGSKAVGINSANSGGEDRVENTADDIAMYTSLDDVFKKDYIDGYTLKLHINTPTITVENGTEVEPGEAITGTVVDAPAGTIIRVVVDGKLYKQIELGANGEFSFPAPEEAGTFEFSVVAKKGYNQSEKVNGNVVVVAPTEVPPPSPSESASPSPSASEDESEEPSESPSASASEDESEEPSESSPSTSPSEDESDEPSTSPSASEDEEQSEAPKDDEPSKSATPKETPKKEDPLADTGSSSVPLIAAGGAMALAGAAFLLFRRSARRHG